MALPCAQRSLTPPILKIPPLSSLTPGPAWNSPPPPFAPVPRTRHLGLVLTLSSLSEVQLQSQALA